MALAPDPTTPTILLESSIDESQRAEWMSFPLKAVNSSGVFGVLKSPVPVMLKNRKISFGYEE